MSGGTNWNLTSSKDVRKFGIIAFVFFGALCGVGLWTEKPVPASVFGALSVLGLGFIVAPGPLKPLHSAWLRVAHLLGRIITLLMLTIAYYLVITPVALVKRLVGGRPLPTKPNKDASSY